jgi:ABC-2 type transport system permease protein
MTILSVLRKDLQILWRDRAALAVLFLMPLVFILPISFALGGGDGYRVNASNRRERLPIVNYDGGARAQELLDALASSLMLESNYPLTTTRQLGLAGAPECVQAGPTCDEKVARALLQRSERVAALVIPADLTASIDAGQHVSLTLLYNPVADVASRQLLEGVLGGAAMQLSLKNGVGQGMGQLNELTAFAPADLRQSLGQQSVTETSAAQQPALELETVQPSNFALKQIPDTYQQTVPGYTVMYVFFIVGYLSGSVRDEKHNGTFKRLLSMPIKRSALLGGKLLAAFVIGVLQVALMFAVGALAFRMGLGRDVPALALLTMALVAAATAIGLAASTSKIGQALTAPLILGALLGGCMFPIDLMPPFLRTLSYLVPHSWALTGYQNLMVRGQGLAQVLPQIGVLLLFAAVFFFIAVRRFDYEE